MNITAANFFIETVYALCQARAWLSHAWVGAAATLALQIGLYPFFQLDTILGAIAFGGLSILPRLLLITWFCWRGLTGRGLLVENAPEK